MLPLPLKDGTQLFMRPIEPRDEGRLRRFHERLSERSVYLRYFSPLTLAQRTAHGRLAQICHPDPSRDSVWVVEDGTNGPERRIVAVARLGLDAARREGEFALLVADEWQGRGLGRKLLEWLVQQGRERGLERIVGHVLPENREMLHLCRKARFNVLPEPRGGEVVVELRLGPPINPGKPPATRSR